MSDYNGWDNRETWAVMLHLDNHRGLYHEYHELFKDCCEKYKPKQLVWKFSDHLREWVEDMCSPRYWRIELDGQMPEWAESMMTDIGSMWRVNWDEIARSITDSIKSELEYTTAQNAETEEE
tara:strand:- start:6408 stop:6773 length:366 start_codon:yes stop_codon:yes gene_type:complete